MRRTALLALLLAAPFALAQPTPVVVGGAVKIPIAISPAAAPKPLSNYYFQVEYGETQPGEKLSGFLKCFMEQDRFFSAAEAEKRGKLLELPLAELPATTGVEFGIAYNPKYASMFVMMDQAARYTRIEWNEHFNMRNDGAYMLLPEVQKLRALAQVMHLRLRMEVKKKQFDKAIVTVRTMFGLAKLLETHPTLIGGLVGHAIATLAVNGIEELIAQPGCPNLYWSFADLPTPFFSLRQGVCGERLLLKSQFGKMLPGDRAMSEKELADAAQTLRELLGMAENNINSIANEAVLTMRTLDEKLMDSIRERLKKEKVKAEVIKEMPKIQLLFLEDVHRYEPLRDELLKWMNRPYPEANDGLVVSEKLLKKERDEGWILAPFLLPAMVACKQAQARLDQRIALLMTLEAIRLHAHDNGGKLPEKLGDIKLAVPNDPVTDKPFNYSVKDGTATLLPNRSLLPTDNRLYDIQIRK